MRNVTLVVFVLMLAFICAALYLLSNPCLYMGCDILLSTPEISIVGEPACANGVINITVGNTGTSTLYKNQVAMHTIDGVDFGLPEINLPPRKIMQIYINSTPGVHSIKLSRDGNYPSASNVTC